MTVIRIKILDSEMGLYRNFRRNKNNSWITTLTFNISSKLGRTNLY